MKKILTVVLIGVFALCVAPAGAQTRQQSELYDKVMAARVKFPMPHSKVKKSTRKALSKLDNDELLSKIATTHPDILIQQAAAMEIENWQTLARAIVKNEKLRRREIIDKFRDEELYAILFDETYGEAFHKTAISNIDSPDTMIRVAREHGNPYIRYLAFFRLGTKNIEMLANDTTADPVAVAARVQSKKSDWTSEIESRQDIGGVISAMVLVPQDARPTVDNIVAACHKYIRKGDESKIPDLKFLLDNYGDLRLAEDYLNSGNQQLYEIGAAWARRKGYNINTGVGSSRVRWGSQR